MAPQIVELGICAILLCFFLFTSHFARKRNLTATTRAGGLAALDRISDWSKWMAGIQTAALALLATLIFHKDYGNGRTLQQLAEFFAAAAFIFLGCALLCSAWVLSALPSLALRLHATHGDDKAVSTMFDVYELPMYGWATGPYWRLLSFP